MKYKPYEVTMHTFMGSTIHPDGSESYKYEIVFNQSLQHTGRFQGIEEGLNRYRKREYKQDFLSSIPNVFKSFFRWIQNL